MNESNEVFRFKQFAIKQDRCAMKVGTDGVLLGAWVEVNGNDKKVLDIGTGTGIIALMVAQKCECMIDAIEIDADAFAQAAENFKESKWAKRLRSFNAGLQNFLPAEDGAYDLIVSNPPFFMDAYKTGNDARNIARHINESLTFDELIEHVVRLLKRTGRFCVIMPVKEGNMFIELCEKKNLFCNKITRVKTKTEKQDKRLLLEMGFERKEIGGGELLIHDMKGNYSEAFVALTKDFYTHFPVREGMVTVV